MKLRARWFEIEFIDLHRMIKYRSVVYSVPIYKIIRKLLLFVINLTKLFLIVLWCLISVSRCSPLEEIPDRPPPNLWSVNSHLVFLKYIWVQSYLRKYNYIRVVQQYIRDHLCRKGCGLRIDYGSSRCLLGIGLQSVILWHFLVLLTLQTRSFRSLNESH